MNIYHTRQEALSNGSTFYQGKPCKNCFSILRYVSTYACVNCSKAPNDNKRAASKRWKNKNKSHIKEYRKQWHVLHKEEEDQYKKEWRLQRLIIDPEYT
jgi:hypothetical protein